jgi:N6-L-threonylcarbamoyladenine synthase
MKENFTILAIETSCDETSAAVVRDGREILSNAISSQIALHEKFGGVVPEVASRMHVEKMNPIIVEALEEAGITFGDIDAVAVTYGPGLIGALLVGLAEAKAIAFALDVPLIGVHHIEGHICANYIEHDLEPPFLCMVVSGGHTHLVEVKDYGSYNILGRTRDDAVGEAFDKVARSIGLGYPGGPKIDILAKEGNGKAIDFPRPFLEQGSYDFSFSGIKSSVLNYLNQMKMKDTVINPADVAASFQEAVVDVISTKTIMAAEAYGYTKIALAGGVASNSRLREVMKEKADAHNLELYFPSPIYCTDNAAMIGVAGYYDYKNGISHDMTLNASSNIQLGQK